MSNLTVQRIIEAGIAPAFVPADEAGDTFSNDNSGRKFVAIRNNSAASMTTTISAEQTETTIDGWGNLDKPDLVLTIPAGEERWAGPLPIKAYGFTPAITYSDETDVEVAALTI